MEKQTPLRLPKGLYKMVSYLPPLFASFLSQVLGSVVYLPPPESRLRVSAVKIKPFLSARHLLTEFNLYQEEKCSNCPRVFATISVIYECIKSTVL